MKKKIIIISVIAVLIAAVAALAYAILPNVIKYVNAQGDIETGNLKEAKAAFYSLGDVKDSIEYYVSISSCPTKAVISYGSGEETNTETYEYDEKGNITRRETDYSVSIYTYDGDGREISEETTWKTDGETEKTAFEYGKNGLVSRQTDVNSDGSVTETLFEYGEDTLVSKQTDIYPDGTSAETIFEYDGHGNVTKRTVNYGYEEEDPDVTKYENTYDSEGRLTFVKSTFGSAVRTETYTYDEKGRLAAKESGGNPGENCKTVYEYDIFGNLLWEKTEYGNSSGSDEYFFDEDGNLIKHISIVTVPGGTGKDEIITYIYSDFEYFR